MQMKSPAFLELEAIKECFQVLGRWVLEVCKDMCSPSITIAASEVPAGDLFEDVCNIESFNGGDMCDILEVASSHVF